MQTTWWSEVTVSHQPTRIEQDIRQTGYAKLSQKYTYYIHKKRQRFLGVGLRNSVPTAQPQQLHSVHGFGLC